MPFAFKDIYKAKENRVGSVFCSKHTQYVNELTNWELIIGKMLQHNSVNNKLFWYTF